MNSTTFAHINNCFRLTIDSSKATITTAWLEKRGCTFDRYVRANGTTEYVFIRISDEVTYAIAWKYPMPAPVEYQYDTQIVLDSLEDSIQQCVEAKAIAQQAIINLDANALALDALADNALAKYPLLA